MRRHLLRHLRAVRRRLLWIEFCRATLLALGWAALVLLFFVVASRLSPVPLDFETLFLWLTGGAAFILLYWMLRHRVHLMQAALRADEALGLKERLSTALMLGEPQAEPEQAVMEDALAWSNGIQPSKAFRADLHRELRLACWPTLALAAAWWFMPQFDLSANTGEIAPVSIEARRETAQRMEEINKQLAQNVDGVKPVSVQKIDRELDLLVKQIAELKMDNTQAMAKLADLKDKIAQRSGEIEKQLARAGDMQNRGEGKMTGDMQKALGKGEFNKAAKALDDLKQKMQKGDMTPQEKQALQNELKSLAAKLGEDSPLGKSLEKAANQMREGKFNEAMADMENALADMKDLELMLAELQQLEKLDYDMKARKEALQGKFQLCEACNKPGNCVGGLCATCTGMGMGHKPWSEGDSRKQGLGMGGPGIGQGSVAQKEEGAIDFKPTRVQGQIQPGQIIARMKVNGTQTAGEITANYEDLRIESAQKAEDAIRRESLPLEYKSLVRDYFNSIKVGGQSAATNAESAGSGSTNSATSTVNPATHPESPNHAHE